VAANKCLVVGVEENLLSRESVNVRSSESRAFTVPFVGFDSGSDLWSLLPVGCGVEWLLQLEKPCYTLYTTGSEFRYAPGWKESETCHTVLGRHTETGQPTLSGLGSGRLTLQHRSTPGQVLMQTVGIASCRSGVAYRRKRHHSNSGGSNAIATAMARGSW